MEPHAAGTPAVDHRVDAPSGRGSRGPSAVAGLVAAGVTLGAAHLTAALLEPRGTPLTAVGDAFVDLTPAWLKDLAIAAFGVADKVALLVGMVVVLGLAAAGLGVLARTRPGLARAGVLAIGLLGAAAAVTRPSAGPLAAVPSLVGAAAGLLALGRLVGLAAGRTRGSAGPAVPTGPDRRAFLGAAALTAAAAVLAGAAGSAVGSLGRTVDAARTALRLPRPARPAAPVPAAASVAVPGVGPLVTPADAFFRIDTALTVPRVDPATWELRVHGLVEQEVRLPFDELLASRLVEAHVTLACVSNPVGGDLIGNARWLGLPVRELLARARPLADADMVLSTSADGFTASTPLEVLTDDRDALLAVGMNGEPLPLQHGFPVRMVVPGLYGFVSATKWVVDLEVTRFADAQAYWTVRGWSERGPVKTSSRIEAPRPGARVAAGRVAVGGTAWAQHTGIAGVEVQVDDGPWRAADLAAPISVDTWRQWSWTWDATPGEHVLRVRATDTTGRTQTEERQDVVPDGATGWHEVRVSVDA
ncbi:molybdopterin-dependent oxidoreductase [Actinotalea sp. Marseille-Q4924]|uniref:molybdopterin-dependent oxidoreductase n=1 Tax=Actinotalea sp. Marseille-Q4924 TaxID=2866571 RepID=UPI001CE3BF69|nr:molybdopterin-dependent oxidoreductase [Actinotalea sp. Marseille-Q4924]